MSLSYLQVQPHTALASCHPEGGHRQSLMTDCDMHPWHLSVLLQMRWAPSPEAAFL